VAPSLDEQSLPGLDRDRVAAWMRAQVVGIEGALRFTLVAAGGSNLTFRVVDDAGHAWALRRPPVAAVLATAHDMDREWRILDALTRDATVPVPKAIARCDDAEVTGAPFYVMAFVDGVILRTAADAAGWTTEEAAAATDSLVDVQIALHALDPDAIGLGTLTRHRIGYVARQLHRWHSQVERGRVRDLPLLGELHSRLVATIPPDSGPASLAHGDYRFDNTVVGPDRHIAAVLDWELCTIGDPVADVAWSLLYWTDPGDPCPFLESAPTLAPAFVRRAEVAASYAARSGRSLDALPWLNVFGYWKMACIVEGVYARRLQGAAGGASSDDPSSIAGRVEQFLAHAADLAQGVC